MKMQALKPEMSRPGHSADNFPGKNEITYPKGEEKSNAHNGYIPDKFSFLPFNDQLDQPLIPQGVNENFIRKLLSILDQINEKSEPEYWLMLARLAEMSLLCAGYYADTCEFCAAGDLLVNPHKIWIHIRGQKFPIRKNRHGKLSEQLNLKNDSMDNFIGWFKKNVLLEVREKSLLEDLYCRMEASGKFNSCYLTDFQYRMNRVASTIGFMNSWQINSLQELHLKLKNASPQTRQFVEENLCNFDRTIFNRLGDDINRMQFEPFYQSEFLKADSFMDL